MKFSNGEEVKQWGYSLFTETRNRIDANRSLFEYYCVQEDEDMKEIEHSLNAIQDVFESDDIDTDRHPMDVMLTVDQLLVCTVASAWLRIYWESRIAMVALENEYEMILKDALEIPKDDN